MFKEVAMLCLVATVGCAGDPGPCVHVNRVECAGIGGQATHVYNDGFEAVSRSVRAYDYYTSYQRNEITEVSITFEEYSAGPPATILATVHCLGTGYVLFERDAQVAP